MKKAIFITVLTLGMLVSAYLCGTAQNHSATTSVKINLSDVISIDKGSAAIGGVVEFNYLTAEDYNSTKTASVPTSLIVTSSKSFDIDVKANGANFEKGNDFIPVNVLTIKPVTGGPNPMNGTPSNVVLSAADQKLVSGADVGGALVLELDYEIPQSRSSSVDMMGKPSGTYTQTVTYTATAR